MAGPWPVDGITFTKRKAISNTGNRPSGALTNYPLKVGIVADPDIGAACLSTGNDLRFALASDELTALKADKNDFAVAAGAATGNFWVGVPSVPSGADLGLYCYYGNAGASPQANPEQAYDSYTKLAWHLEETGNPYIDAALAHDSNTTTDPTTATGKIGQGVTFDGSSDFIMTPHATDLSWDYDQPFTLSGWIKTASTQAYTAVMGKQNAASPYKGYVLFANTSGGKLALFLEDTSATAAGRQGSTNVCDGNWHSFHAVYDGSGLVTGLTLFVDGAADTMSTLQNNRTGSITTTESAGIGARGAGGGQKLTGTLDETRFAATNRALAWAAYDHLTQNTAAGGLTWGPEEAATTGGVPYPLLVSGQVRCL